MIPEPLTLLLPVSPQRGRRALGVLAAVAGHAMLLMVLGAVRSPSASAVPPVRATNETKPTVWVAPMAPPPPPQAPAIQKPVSPSAAKLIAYAAGPRSMQPGRDWRQLLPRALMLQAEGLNAPSFVIENLDIALVATLATRGLAIIVAGRPPFADAREVRWTPAGPSDIAALPAAWTQRVARRAIILPPEWVRTLALAPGEQVYLLISTDLDAAILAAQLAAAERRGVALSALARTRGRLLPTTDGILVFYVDTVDLRS